MLWRAISLLRLLQIMAGRVSLVYGRINGVVSSCLGKIRVLINIKASVQVLGAKEGKHNNVDIYTRHENAHDQAVVVTLGEFSAYYL